MEKNMTVGKPMKLILFFAIPILLGSVMQQFYNLADTMIVGKKLGTDALAAVGATGSVVSLIFSFVFGLMNGFAIIVAQYYGAKNEREMKKSIATILVLSLFFTVIIFVVSYVFMRPLLDVLNTPPEIMEDSLSYIRIFLLGLLVTTIYNLCCCLLKAIGNSVTPLIFLAVSSVLNVGMDLLFVFVFHWGIEGAAFATVIAQAISAVLSVIYVIKKCPILHVKKSDFVFDGGLIIKLLTTGFSMALMLSIVGIGSVILQSGINGLGKDTVAAHTAGRKILEIVMNPMAAIGAATATFAGQNYGAGKMKRIKEGTRDGIIMTSIWSTAMCLVVYLFAPYLIYLVTDKENLEIVETATMYLKISVPFFYSLGVLVVVRNVLQGIGKRVVPIVASIIEMAGKILVIWLLVPRIKYLGICLAEPSIWLIDGILVLVVFLTVRFADSLNVEERRM